MWNTFEQNPEIVQALFEGTELIVPISRLSRKPQMTAVEPLGVTVEPAVTPAAIKPNTPVINLDVAPGKSSYSKYTFILSTDIESYSAEVRQMMNNLITKGLLISQEVVIFKKWPKANISVFEISAMGTGCYFIMGLKCLGFNGMMQETDMIKNAGLIVITASDPEKLNTDIPQKQKLWELIKQHAR